ncbi:MAG: hypothetical protein HFJ48_03700 [Clostridia bacterium]|nr:hypothetical protein [Clostridia bacterium]
MKKTLIIDERIRKEEYEYLKQFFNIQKLPLSKDVYDEISGHSDIFYCKLNNEVICAPNASIKEKHFRIGEKSVEKNYPNDVLYNACQIGEYVVGSKYTDASIPVDIQVRQGYVKCSIVVTSKNSCITTDEWIAKKLIMYGIDSLYINENNINLFDRDGHKSNINGFIGGATLVFDNKFVLFGDIDNLFNKEKIIAHINKYHLELMDFKGLDVFDYGSGLMY